MLPSQNGVVEEYSVLWTAQKYQKQKRWQDGFARVHRFNNRLLLYDSTRSLVGDKYLVGYPEFGTDNRPCLHDDEELELDKHIVQVQYLVRTEKGDEKVGSGINEVRAQRRQEIAHRASTVSKDKEDVGVDLPRFDLPGLQSRTATPRLGLTPASRRRNPIYPSSVGAFNPVTPNVGRRLDYPTDSIHQRSAPTRLQNTMAAPAKRTVEEAFGDMTGGFDSPARHKAPTPFRYPLPISTGTLRTPLATPSWNKNAPTPMRTPSRAPVRPHPVYPPTAGSAPRRIDMSAQTTEAEKGKDMPKEDYDMELDNLEADFEDLEKEMAGTTTLPPPPPKPPTRQNFKPLQPISRPPKPAASPVSLTTPSPPPPESSTDLQLSCPNPTIPKPPKPPSPPPPVEPRRTLYKAPKPTLRQPRSTRPKPTPLIPEPEPEPPSKPPIPNPPAPQRKPTNAPRPTLRQPRPKPTEIIDIPSQEPAPKPTIRSAPQPEKSFEFDMSQEMDRIFDLSPETEKMLNQEEETKEMEVDELPAVDDEAFWARFEEAELDESDIKVVDMSKDDTPEVVEEDNGPEPEPEPESATKKRKPRVTKPKEPKEPKAPKEPSAAKKRSRKALASDDPPESPKATRKTKAPPKRRTKPLKEPNNPPATNEDDEPVDSDDAIMQRARRLPRLGEVTKPPSKPPSKPRQKKATTTPDKPKRNSSLPPRNPSPPPLPPPSPKQPEYSPSWPSPSPDPPEEEPPEEAPPHLEPSPDPPEEEPPLEPSRPTKQPNSEQQHQERDPDKESYQLTLPPPTTTSRKRSLLSRRPTTTLPPPPPPDPIISPRLQKYVSSFTRPPVPLVTSPKTGQKEKAFRVPSVNLNTNVRRGLQAAGQSGGWDDGGDEITSTLMVTQFRKEIEAGGGVVGDEIEWSSDAEM